jgi:predicted RNase H-like nuclease (RuvC/YqgF family)
MADIELVIKIDEKTYNIIKGFGDIPIDNTYEVAMVIINGTPLNEVLDEIRAEIMDFEEELFHRPNTDYTDYAAVRHCVEIIDKYREERYGDGQTR